MSPTVEITAILLVIVTGVVMLVWVQRQKSQKLRQRFGPEYDRTMNEYGNKRRAEHELETRQKRVETLNIRPLSPDERDRFVEAWQTLQLRFVDEPADAIADADRLVKEVMETRGYPVGDFEQRTADISVDHPNVVMNYRAACDIAVRSQNEQVSTEDLRQAMVHYRALFEDLLETTEQPMERIREMA